MKFYHAATPEVMDKIVSDGMIKASWDGVVYLCKNPLDACKFLIIRGIESMSVIQVNLNEREVQESKDHNESFFGCKAYTHRGNIQLNGKEKVSTYIYDFEKERQA